MSMALEQSYDSPSSGDVSLKDMNIYRYSTHHKAIQRAHRVYNSWELFQTSTIMISCGRRHMLIKEIMLQIFRFWSKRLYHSLTGKQFPVKLVMVRELVNGSLPYAIETQWSQWHIDGSPSHNVTEKYFLVLGKICLCRFSQIMVQKRFFKIRKT